MKRSSPPAKTTYMSGNSFFASSTMYSEKKTFSIREAEASLATDNLSFSPMLKIRPRLSTSALKKPKRGLPTSSPPFPSFFDFWAIMLKVLGRSASTYLLSSSCEKRLNHFSSFSSSLVIWGRCRAIRILENIPESVKAST